MNFFTRQGYGRALLLAAATVMITAGAGAVVGQTDITSKFNDANFRAYVYSRIGKTAPAPILDSDVRGISVVDVFNKGISDISGIEYFTALKSLDCSNNQLTTLNVSGATALTSLYCSDNQLTALDVSKNIALTSLYCYNNQLTTLNVSGAIALTELYCYDNQLTALDVSKNIALTTLWCFSNQLTMLNVSGAIALTKLWCQSGTLTALDVSKNTALTELICSGPLIALDVSKNTKLEVLSCQYTQLTALDVSKNTALKILECEENQLLTTLNVSRATALTRLWCSRSQLTALDVSDNTALESLRCGDNQLTVLDVSKNTKLERLVCYNNRLIALNVLNNTALTVLNCGGNQLTTLNVSKNTALTELYVYYNYLSNESDIIGLDKSNLTEGFIINPQFTVITFNTSGGSAVNSQTQLGALGTIKASKPADPTRSGYLFGGWYKEVTCTGSAWNFNDAVIPNMTLYAKWIPLTETPTPIYVVADFNQRAESAGKNKQVMLKWRYSNKLGINGRFYVYRRETQPSSGGWALLNLNNFIDAETSENDLSASFVDDGIAINKSYEYRIVFVVGTTAPNATTPPTSNSENISVNTYLPAGTPGTDAYIPYNKTSDTYVVGNVTYKDIYGTSPRDLSGRYSELFRHLLSGYQLSSDGNTHLSRWSDMGKLVVPLDGDVAGMLAGARIILNTRKSKRPAAAARMTAGCLGSETSVATAAANMLAEFNERGGYSISNYALVDSVPNALSGLSGTKTSVFWVLDRYLVHGNDVNDDRNAGTADYAYYGVGLIFHDLKVSYLETGSPFFSAVSNLPGVFNENFNATIAGFRYKFGNIKEAIVSGVKNGERVPGTYTQELTKEYAVTVGNMVSALDGYERSAMWGVGSSTSISQTVGTSTEVEVGEKFTLGGDSWGGSVELGASVKVGETYSRTHENSWSTSHEYTTAEMFQRTNETSKTVGSGDKKTYTVSVTLQPHTQAMLRQGPASIEMSIDYDYPVVISYKVTVVALGSSRRNGSIASKFMRPVATYGIDSTSEKRVKKFEIDASENFNMLWGYRNDRASSRLHSADTVSLNRMWTQMKQATGTVSNFCLLGFKDSDGSASEDALVSDYVRPIAVGMTNVKPMTVVRSTVKYKSESMISEIYESQPLYPLYRIEAVGLDSISLINGSSYFVDRIALTGRNEYGVDFYGFHSDKGGWALTDAAGNSHNGGIAKLTTQEGTGRPIIVADGKNTGVVYLRYLIKDGVYSYDGCTRYMTASDLGMRTAIIPVYVRSAGSLDIKAQPQGGTVTVASAATYPLSVEVVAVGDVSYQWYVNTEPKNTGGLPISGATGPTYNAPIGTIGVLYYYVVVSVNDPSVEPVVSMLAVVQSVSIKSTDRVIPVPNSNAIEKKISIAPVKALTAQLTAGPNPASRSSGAVSFFREGSRVSYATLFIYDASGNVVKKIRVIDDAVGSQTRRKVSTWNLRDNNGRPVAEGTYLVRGVVKTKDGNSEKVSLVVGVR